MTPDELNDALNEIQDTSEDIATAPEWYDNVDSERQERINARLAIVAGFAHLRADNARKDAEIRKLRSMLAAYKYEHEHRPARPLPRRNCVKRWQDGA